MTALDRQSRRILEQADAVMARLLIVQVDRLVAMLADRGATEDELEQAEAWYRALWDSQAEANRADLERCLDEPDAPTTVLQ